MELKWMMANNGKVKTYSIPRRPRNDEMARYMSDHEYGRPKKKLRNGLLRLNYCYVVVLLLPKPQALLKPIRFYRSCIIR